jgi:ribosomal protein S18 acetylase RimI-like enzyme
MITLQHRPYTPADLPTLLQLIGASAAATNFCINLHPGDVRHFMSNYLRGGDPTPHFWLFTDGEAEDLRAVVMIYDEDDPALDVIVHPAAEIGPETLDALYDFAEARLLELLTARGAEIEEIACEALPCLAGRAELLQARGYVAEETQFVFSRRSLLGEIPAPRLPEGFTIRPCAGEGEADALGALHARAFDSSWGPGEYLQVMRTPGFEIDHELVVVAPDGALVAFCIYWVDPVSKSGLFEPVGCDPDYQRRGLTTALLYEGMRRMRAEGAETAIVKFESAEEDPVPTAFYPTVGFVIEGEAMDYVKNPSPLRGEG